MKESSSSVLMTADAVGGVWTYALDLARGLARRGASTVLAVPGPDPDAEQRAEAQAAGVEIVAIGGGLDWMAGSPEQVRETVRALERLARERRSELIHLNSAAYAAGARFDAPLVVACHSCLKTWWAAVKGAEPIPPDFAWRIALTTEGYRAADALIAPSAAFAEATRRAYDLGRAPEVIWNGARARASTRPSPEAPPGPFAFTAGRLWDEGKGAAVLDRAAAGVALPVCAAGPTAGPNGAAVELRHARALGRLPAEDLAGWLAARPIFVAPSLYEPFGLSVLEAAQAGCALVLSDIPTFRELWHGAAVFAPPGDEDALAHTIEALAADPDGRRALGEAARERATRCTVERMADATFTLYRRLLNRGRRAEAAA